MRVWDIRRAVQALNSVKAAKEAPLCLRGERQMAVNTLYAALFEPAVNRLELYLLPKSHQEGPDYLNVLRILDVPQAVAMAAERCAVRLHQTDALGWDFPAALKVRLGWDERRFSVEWAPLILAK
jgi:hypothetical protein